MHQLLKHKLKPGQTYVDAEIHKVMALNGALTAKNTYM